MPRPRVSIKEVAKAAGVSRAAVSRALNNSGYISDEKREVIHRVIRELGFRPNTLARSLVSNQSQTIGLCLPYLDSPFIANLMAGVEAEAERHGYDIFMSHTKEDPDVERAAIIRMIDRQVDGIIIVPVLGEKSCIPEIRKQVPTVALLRKPPGVEKNLVLAADYPATRRSFSLLLDKGHRRIGIITGPPGVSTINARWQAVCDEMHERGLEIDPSLVVECPLNYHDSYAAARRLLQGSELPTAIYAVHYWGSSALLWLIYDMGLSLPDDISAVAYESFQDWNLISTLKFATNIFPSSQMGREAMAALHGMIAANTLEMDQNIEIQLEFHPHNSVKDLTADA